MIKRIKRSKRKKVLRSIHSLLTNVRIEGHVNVSVVKVVTEKIVVAEIENEVKKTAIVGCWMKLNQEDQKIEKPVEVPRVKNLTMKIGGAIKGKTQIVAIRIELIIEVTAIVHEKSAKFPAKEVDLSKLKMKGKQTIFSTSQAL